MTPVATEQTVDLGALGTDAARRLGELRDQRGRLALDSLLDGDVAHELESVEREIRSTEQALERVELAQTEHDRREAAAQADAAVAAREAALDGARKLQGEREAAAKAVDAALEGLSAAVDWWLTTCEKQDRELTAAGRAPSTNSARARAYALDGAYMTSMRSLPRGILSLEAVPSVPHQKRLADA